MKIWAFRFAATLLLALTVSPAPPAPISSSAAPSTTA